MTKPYLRDFRAEATTLLQERGHWIIAGIDTQMAWPVVDQVVTFGGRDFVMRAATEDSEPTIAVMVEPGHSVEEARQQILQFASALAWRENAKVEIFLWTGGGRPHGVGKIRGRTTQYFFEAEGLPEIADETALCALAFYREGLSISNPFFAFLSFYKTIATIHRNGRERGQWISQALERLDANKAKNRVEELRNTQADIGKYLYDEGRNAIAHAELESFVNPDRIEDHERIRKDLPVMRNLAAIAIEEKFSIYSWIRDKSILTSVAGFRAALSPGLLEALLNNTPTDADHHVSLPDRVALVARRNESFYVIESMAASELRHVDGGFLVLFTNQDQTIQVCVGVDIRGNELHLDPIDGLRFQSDRSSPPGIEREILMLKFRRLILSNGRLEIWDEETNQLVGRTKSFLPVNATVNDQSFDDELAQLTNLLEGLN
jgi:predicted RNA-binding protein YlxR (DUF448 family)